MLQPPRYLWTSSSLDVTCLSFGLDPEILPQKKIICQKCLTFFDVKLKGILVNKANKPRSEASTRLHCDKPWHPDNASHPLERKRIAMRDFIQLFENNAVPNVTEFLPVPVCLAKGRFVAPASTEAVIDERVEQETLNNSKDKINSLKESTILVTCGTQIDPLPMPSSVDPNNIINKDTAAELVKAINDRDTASWPLQHHELGLLDSLSIRRPVVIESPVDTNNVIKEDI